MRRLLLITFALMLCLTGCKGDKDKGKAETSFPDSITCRDIVNAATEAAPNEAHGATYSPEEENFTALDMALWTDGSMEDCAEYELLADYTIYYLPVSYNTYEIAVLKAKDEADVDKLLDVLQRRKERMKTGDNGFYDPNFESISEKSMIYTDGPFAIMLMTEENEKAKEAIEKLKA